MTESIRVIRDDPCDGPTNMARDELLLQRIGGGESPPTLRLYGWSTPTVSLGYFQRYRDFEELPPPAGELPVVRRLTGGGAILHDLELTYSLTLPVSHPLARPPIARLYTAVHDAVVETVATWEIDARSFGQPNRDGGSKGPFFCFARHYEVDIMIGTDKLAGSAQRRTSRSVLQHGSIIIERRFVQQPSAAIRDHASVSTTQLMDRFLTVLSEREQLNFDPQTWSSGEIGSISALEDKYRSSEWTQRR